MTRQKKGEPLMEAVPFDEFIRRYGDDEQDDTDPDEEEVLAITPKGERYLDDAGATYVEPEPPARTIEELDGQWKANGMPDERRAEMIAEVKRLGLLDPPPHRPSAAAGAQFLAESFAALGIPAAITEATIGMLLGKEADKPLDVPLREGSKAS